MQYLDVVDKVNMEVAKLNTLAALIGDQSDILDDNMAFGIASIIESCADEIKGVVHEYRKA